MSLLYEKLSFHFFLNENVITFFTQFFVSFKNNQQSLRFNIRTGSVKIIAPNDYVDDLTFGGVKFT